MRWYNDECRRSRKNWKENVWKGRPSPSLYSLGIVVSSVSLEKFGDLCYRKLSFFSSLSLDSNACHRKNGGGFKRWATKPPGALRSSHVSKDIKSTRWRNMKCNDAAGKGKGGERRGGVAYTASIFIHQPRLRFFPTEDSFAVFPLERQMRNGAPTFRPREPRFIIIALLNERLVDSRPPFDPLPFPLDFGGKRKKEITGTNRDVRFCSGIEADVNR